MHREVCLKHRKNRREIFQRVRTQFEFAEVFVLFVVSGAGIWPAPLICGHRSRAGCLNANQTMPVQLRLTAPFSTHLQHGVRQLAQLGLQNLAGSGQHRGGGRE
jgi:hypothetical protein